MNKIINLLKVKKSIPLDKFINIALYDKELGYYMKKNPFGEEGDFITSPHISNLFGEMIAIWCVAFWEHLGKPKKILIVEMGPGDGSLCKNLLEIFKRFKNFYKCLEINLFEISHKLKILQKEKINNKKVKWIKNIKDINSGPIIFLANEFFDSLPIKQVKKQGKLFFEKHVCLKDDERIKYVYKKANKNLVKNIKNLNLIKSGNAIEYPKKSIDYLNTMAKKINRYNGGLLTFDYGYTKKNYGNTLQSVKRHKYSNPLLNIGTSDITSHVNFTLFKEILINNKLNLGKIVTQSEFLQKMGILERSNIISKKMSFKEKTNLFYRMNRLLSPNYMGVLFKVLFASKNKKGRKFSLGF
jgi:NADH dehydrogenase [ubiquinone] 1 alpha subcomplex assembly factor 7